MKRIDRLKQRAAVLDRNIAYGCELIRMDEGTAYAALRGLHGTIGEHGVRAFKRIIAEATIGAAKAEELCQLLEEIKQLEAEDRE